MWTPFHADQAVRYQGHHPRSMSRATLEPTLDTVIGQVFTPYRPGRRHGHQFWCNKSSCGVVKSLFEASIQKTHTGPSTQLIIKATSCIEKVNAKMKAEEHS